MFGFKQAKKELSLKWQFTHWHKVPFFVYLRPKVLNFIFKGELMFNKITLVGNLTKDIELSYPNQKAFARGAIATNRKYRSQSGETKEEVCFLNFIINGKQAEVANQYLKKGSKVLFEGRLAQNDYIDNSGVKRNSYQVVVEEMRFLDAKPADEAKQAEKKAQTAAAAPAKATQETTAQQADDFDADGAALPF